MNENRKKSDKLFRKVCRKIGQTVREHRQIVENDRVLVGLSGGKDSMIMLESLANRKKAFPFRFELFVAHIIPSGTGYNVNISYLEQFCESMGLKLISREIYPDLNEKDKSPCFICSWHRRKALFDLSRELNCNRIAFGHHRDDALQTFLMNMLYHGSISSMPYKLEMFGGRVCLIRPMMDLWESDLAELARFRNYASVEKSCPHEELTKRNYTSEILKNFENDFPGSKRNMFHALNNIYYEYLPNVKKRSDHDPC